MIRSAHLYKYEQKCDSYTVKMFLIESFWSVTESVEIHLVRMWEQKEAVSERSDKDQTQKRRNKQSRKQERKIKKRKEGKKKERQTNKEGREKGNKARKKARKKKERKEKIKKGKK